MRTRTFGISALVIAVVTIASCASDRGQSSASVDAADASVSHAANVVAESSEARQKIDALRARFRVTVREPEPQPGHPAALRTRPVIDAGAVVRFETDGETHAHAVVAAEAKHGMSRTASVALPLRAQGMVKLEDDKSRVSIGFALEGTREAPLAVAQGMALYVGALDGADVVHRVHSEGTEDYVVFESRPAKEELSYAVDVSRVAGLRLVSNTLEFLDDGGSPALRIAPPYVVDAKGERHDAKLAVIGCAYDTSPAGPWGRAVTKPGAASCAVRLAWSGVAYPAIVDPSWGATGSMATARQDHTATVLASGEVLVAGGFDGAAPLASAELFDPLANGGAGSFAATGAMATARYSHTATLLATGKVLVAAGRNASTGLSGAELYDPAGNGGAGAFAATGSVATARYWYTASALLSGKVLVAGGYNAGDVTTAEVFDPAANGGVGAFAATGPMQATRHSHTASVLPSGKVLLTGGAVDSALTSAELFDPAGNSGAGTFGPTGSMATARQLHTATVLLSGKVLVTGGLNGSANASAELFDPAANSGAGAFAATGSMTAMRYSHTASGLASGKVLVVGGTDGTPLASAELFDPAANGGVGAFAATTSMAAARQSHAAAVLASGIVLVAGGTNGTLLASAELFGGAPGDTCSGGGSYCLSGFCVDGHCCNTACNGGCDRCDLAGKEGTCTAAPSGDPGASPACAPPYACDGTGATCPTSCTSDAACVPADYCAPNGTCQPQRAQGAACNTTTDCKLGNCRICTSGNCADGFCCDTPCKGACLACAATLKQSGGDGACGPTKDGIDPHNECAPGVLCGPDGMCNGAGGCRLVTPVGTSCGPGDSCSSGAGASAQVCDGNGACPAPSTIPCGAYACGATACNTSCAKNNDCAAGSTCDTATSKCVSGATCDGDHTTTGASGTKLDCAPYKCVDDGTCRASCTSVTDCVAPAVCDVAGKCVPPAPTGDSGGCSVARGDAGSRSPVVPFSLLGLAALFVRRRRDSVRVPLGHRRS